MIRYRKISIIFSASLLFLAVVYIGIGYFIASTALLAHPGCGIWSDNTPDNWTVTDNWKDFEQTPDPEERIQMRRSFDVAEFQIQDYETVSFMPRGDLDINIRGWYVEVDPDAPAAILVHGMPVNGKCKPEMLLLQAYLAKGGINSLSIDLRNYGESDTVSKYFTVGMIEYKDVLGAYDWLIEHKKYKPGSIGMCAFSAGGGTAIAFAEEPGITALWLDSAVLDFPLLVRNELNRLGFPGIFSYSAVAAGSWLTGVDLKKRSPMEAAVRAGNRAVFLTHAVSDFRVSISHSKNFEKMMSPEGSIHTWYIYDTGHVDAIWEESELYQERLISFFSTYLNK